MSPHWPGSVASRRRQGKRLFVDRIARAPPDVAL